jgi:hypothetical protein
VSTRWIKVNKVSLRTCYTNAGWEVVPPAKQKMKEGKYLNETKK